MIHKPILFFLWLMPVWLMAQNVDPKPLDRFAFGSCAFHFGQQVVWNSVLKNDPQLWLWLGDNIYSETLDVEKRAGDYVQLGNNRNYKKLLAHNPVIATWDDHDYGNNDCGKEFPVKAESKRLFLEFFNEPKDSERWQQPGIYTSYSYGSGDQKVKFILLDLRYERDKPGSTADMMGEAQWIWLERQLPGNDAALTFIASSVQFVSNIDGFENWDKFPACQDRMLKLLEKMGTKGVLFLTGDVHFGQLSMRKYDQLHYPVYDLTSSGLTHGNQIFGFKHPYQVDESRFGFRNFGMVLIDWAKRSVTFQVRNVRNRVKYSWDIPFTAIGH